MNFPQISIEQRYSQIAIETSRGAHSMTSPQGDLQIQQVDAALNVSTEAAMLEIDNSAAWLALGVGKQDEWLELIHSQLRQQYLTNLSKIVEEGHQMANFTSAASPIAEIAKQRVTEQSIIQYTGKASTDNVKLDYTPAKLDMEWDMGEAQIIYTPNKPDITYTPGRVDVYLQQQNYIRIDILNLDIYV